MSWIQIDEFTSQSGAFILRGPLIIGGRYAIRLVNEPVNVFRNWITIVVSEQQSQSFDGQRISFLEIRCTTPIYQFIVGPPRAGWARRFAYYFPERNRIGPRIVRLFREEGS